MSPVLTGLGQKAGLLEPVNLRRVCSGPSETPGFLESMISDSQAVTPESMTMAHLTPKPLGDHPCAPS